MKLFSILIICALAIITMEEDLGIEKILQTGNSQFTARMFHEVIKSNEGKSVVISAFSVITPLAQLALASEGPTHDELLNAIGFPDDNTTAAIFSLIDVKDSATKGIQLKKTTKLYISDGYKVKDKFAKVSESVFHSDIANINFSDNENAAKEINLWVEDQTNRRIQNLVSPTDINYRTIAMLVNALYFKGTWKYPFSEGSTGSENFHVTKTKTIKVTMMHNTMYYSYGYSDQLRSKFLELPYDGDQASLLIVLPDDVEYIDTLIEQLKDPNILDNKTKRMEETDINVSLPKFKIETTTDLKDILQKMNVKKIFSPEANLNKLIETDKELYISKATQKAFIEINEEGAEATAANVFQISYPDSVNIHLPNDFIADHPFVFYLKVHNDILFSGIFYGP